MFLNVVMYGKGSNRISSGAERVEADWGRARGKAGSQGRGPDHPSIGQPVD